MKEYSGYIIVKDHLSYITCSIGVSENPESELHKVVIGNFCNISPLAMFYLNGDHDYRNATTYTFTSYFRDYYKTLYGKELIIKGGIDIGNDVSIGAYATILSGAKIGNGCIIMPHTVVTKEIPDYAVYGGNPPRVIRYRFSEDKIRILQKMAWWDWRIRDIYNAVPLLMSSNIDELFNYYLKKVK